MFLFDGHATLLFCCLNFTTVLLFSIAGLAPLASYFFSAAKKSNQKKPPQQLRPVKNTGFPFSQHHYHAAPELAKDAQTCWRRKPMITMLAKWLAEVEKDQRQKTIKHFNKTKAKLHGHKNAFTLQTNAKFTKS